MKPETRPPGERLKKPQSAVRGRIVEIGQRLSSLYNVCILPATDKNVAGAHLETLYWPRRIARCCGASLTLLGVVVLFGWFLGIGSIKSVRPGLMEMKANTALCFLLSGAALWTTASPRCTFRHRISSAGAYLIITVGLATAFEYLSGANLGIDEMLIRDPPEAEAAHWVLQPGRMALVTALAFVMAGSSLLLLRGRATAVAQLLACGTALTALFSLATYLWRDVAMTGVEPYTALALHTAVGFGVLAVGLLAAAPSHGPVAILVSPTLSGALARVLLPAAIGITLVLGTLEVAGLRAGWYRATYGMALFVLTNGTVLAGVILYVAHRAFLSEMTARKSEDQVRQLNAVLELRVQERTQALDESERFSHSTLDALSAHIAIVDDKGNILATNRRWQEFALANSATNEVGVGANYLDTCDRSTGLYSEESVAVASGIRAVIRGEQAEFGLEYPCHSPSEKRWFMVRATRFAGDGPIRVVISHVNITERKQNEVALAERVQLAALTADVGLALTREVSTANMLQKCSEAIVQHVGAAFARVWTLNAAEQVLELQASAGLYTNIDGKHARIPVGHFKIGQIAQTRQPQMTNTVIGDPRVHDQEWAQHEGMVSFAGYPLVAEDQFSGVVALFSRQPLTETALAALATVADGIAAGIQRRQAVESLRLNVAAMEAAANGIAITDVTGTLVWVNPAFTKLTGYSMTEVRGHKPSILMSEIQGPEFYERLLKTMTADEVWQGQLVNRRKDGSLYNEEMTITPVRDTTGKISHFVAIKQDITERIRNEELIRANGVELQIAKDAADCANRAKSEFLANMSHEIRTPMNGIIGLTGLALDTSLAPEQREYLDGVMRSADALLVLINSILDFSKIEAGKLELEHLKFDLRQSLGDAMKVLAFRAHEKNLELLYEVQPDVPDELIGDAARLWQVVVNLVSNALKFTHQGEIAVLVELEELGVDAASLRFTVSDTGIGIPPDKRGSLFQPFTQADSSTTRQYGGTGLGLAISAQLVALMGGRIWFESEVKHGTQFHFTARFDRQTAGESPHAPLQRAELVGLRVLVVDDNATHRRIQTDLLTHWGMKPTAMATGAAALVCLRASIESHDQFDLILLDLIMPEMDGFAVLKQIRALPEIDRPTILMLSFVNLREHIERARELGADLYLMKPILPAELFDAIKTALGQATKPSTMRKDVAPAMSVEPLRRRLRILVAEDNSLNQLLAKRTLEKAGYSVTVANNGEEALAACGFESFDLILMDVQMPLMDGFQATARIRQLELGTDRHQQIVAMTAHALKGDRERCLEAGMDGYVSKPIRNSELFAAIAAAVNKSEQIGPTTGEPITASAVSQPDAN